MTVTLARRLLGLLFVVLAVTLYLGEAERGRFACERSGGTCVLTVERPYRAPERSEYRLADILGVGAKWSYWEEAPGARNHLAQVRSRSELDAQKLYQSRSVPRGRASSSRQVMFTRQGLVTPRPGLAVDAESFHAFLDGQGERFELVHDARLSALPVPVVLLALGLFLVVLRGPDPPPEG